MRVIECLKIGVSRVFASPFLFFSFSMVNNQLITNSARDWLYFAAAVRAWAKETLHVVYRLDPISTNKFEGFVKVADGPRSERENEGGTRIRRMELKEVSKAVKRKKT